MQPELLKTELEKIDAERADILARIEAETAKKRAAALGNVLALIVFHKLTRAECESPTWRKRAYAKRGPRKPKLVEAAKAA